jgi:hypothetical protein
MVTPIDIGLVVAGAVILFAGAALSVYGVALLGAVVGGGGGFLLAPELGFGATPQVAAAVLVGVLAGVVLSYLLLSLAIGLLGFAVGSYAGVVVADVVLGTGVLRRVGGALAVGVAVAALGTLFKRTAMIGITSFLGAALASRVITPSDFGEAQSNFTADPLLFDLASPLFLGLFVLGVLSQFGLFQLGYVTTLIEYLPGASELTDREKSAE